MIICVSFVRLSRVLCFPQWACKRYRAACRKGSMEDLPKGGLRCAASGPDLNAGIVDDRELSLLDDAAGAADKGEGSLRRLAVEGLVADVDVDAELDVSGSSTALLLLIPRRPPAFARRLILLVFARRADISLDVAAAILR